MKVNLIFVKRKITSIFLSIEDNFNFLSMGDNFKKIITQPKPTKIKTIVVTLL